MSAVALTTETTSSPRLLSVRWDGVKLWREAAFWESPLHGRWLVDLFGKRSAGAVDCISLAGAALDNRCGDRISRVYDLQALVRGLK